MLNFVSIATCGHPFENDSTSLVITSYSHPAVEGSNITFSCPPGLVLTGPSNSACMGNGEWEPDPRAVECDGANPTSGSSNTHCIRVLHPIIEVYT